MRSSSLPESSQSDQTMKKVVSAASARRSAGMFSWGNIIIMLPGLFFLPILFFGTPEKMSSIFMFILMLIPMILWFGLSIAIYIIAKHNPNQRVGYFTQQAAHRYYATVGFIVVAGTFYGNDVNYWLGTWVIAALILVPLSVRDIFLIKKEQWFDVEIEGEAS